MHKPLPATDGTTTRMFLLLLHFPEHGVLFDLDETATLFLRETEPELLDALTLFGSAYAPNLIALGRRRWLRTGRCARFVRRRGIWGRRRWVLMGMIVRVGMSWKGSLCSRTGRPGGKVS
jgi:hypothetical protein